MRSKNLKNKNFLKNFFKNKRLVFLSENLEEDLFYKYRFGISAGPWGPPSPVAITNMIQVLRGYQKELFKIKNFILNFLQRVSSQKRPGGVESGEEFVIYEEEKRIMSKTINIDSSYKGPEGFEFLLDTVDKVSKIISGVVKSYQKNNTFSYDTNIFDFIAERENRARKYLETTDFDLYFHRHYFSEEDKTKIFFRLQKIHDILKKLKAVLPMILKTI